MAMMQCPHCGQQVSDKAEFCPHCNERLIEEKKIKCSECGAEVSATLKVCPNCGAPLTINDDIQKVEVAKITTPSVDKKTKKTILLLLVSALVIAGIVFAVITNNKKNYANKWQSTYESLVVSMLSGAAEAEKTASLIHDVWYNTIYKEADPKTNPYTFRDYYRKSEYTSKTYASDSYFNSDFNDSLGVLFKSDTYKASASLIDSNQKNVATKMSSLSDKIPEGKENAYNAISALYDQYLGLTNLAINPTGNLNSYTSSFNKYDSDFMAAYNKANTFVGK